mgnify:CR=1 FL=1
MDEEENRNTTRRPSAFPHKEDDPLANRFGTILDRVDTLIYIVIGGSFILAALIAIIYSYYDLNITLMSALHSKSLPNAAQAVISFISGLLLVLIIMEVLSTVTHYLKSRTTSLRPFLFIGIVSATRSILSIGARLSIEGINQQGPIFINAMIELGVNAGVVLALGLTLMLIGRLTNMNLEEP